MLGLWITLAVLLALAIFLWRLRLGLYVVFGRGQAAADLTIGQIGRASCRERV